jgi:hypothetical protein
MNQFFVGNTLINDAYLGSIRVEDILANPYLEIDYLVVAGGGAGGGTNFTTTFSGGGGAGGLLTGSAIIAKLNTPYQVIVGAAGTGSFTSPAGKAGQDGQNSSLIGGSLNVIATGGGAGGGTTNSVGRNGGSGGGGAAGGGGGTAVMGQGKDGGVGVSPLGGGGGGASTAGSGVIGGSGSVWLDGITYARGGASSGSNTPDIYGGGGRGSGDNNTSGQNGKTGTVIIRYPGTGSKATGGKITFSDGYTYHQFFEFGGVYSATSSFTY